MRNETIWKRAVRACWVEARRMVRVIGTDTVWAAVLAGAAPAIHHAWPWLQDVLQGRDLLVKGSDWRCVSTDNEAANTGVWDNTEGSAVRTLPQSCLICARISPCSISTGGLHIHYMMNMSIPVPCTFLVTADKSRSSLFIYILVLEHAEHYCKTLGQRTSVFLWYSSKTWNLIQVRIFPVSKVLLKMKAKYIEEWDISWEGK